MNIYLDFDGTVVEHEYPEIGQLNPNALEVIKKLQDAGHTIILNTMRVEFDDGTMEAAIEYINLNEQVAGIVITELTDRKIHPRRWDLDKVENDIYIDDMAPDIPMTRTVRRTGLMVDWLAVESQLIEKGILKKDV